MAFGAVQSVFLSCEHFARLYTLYGPVSEGIEMIPGPGVQLLLLGVITGYSINQFVFTIS